MSRFVKNRQSTLCHVVLVHIMRIYGNVAKKSNVIVHMQSAIDAMDSHEKSISISAATFVM